MQARLGRPPATGLCLFIATALLGCSEPVDDLDPDTVAQLGREVGDAMGPARSGRYRWQLSDAGCGCDDLLTGAQLTLCGALLAGGGPGPWTADLDIWVADGQLQIGIDLAPNAAMVGAFHDDGSARVGAVSRLDTLLTTGDVVTRFDGAFTEAGEPETGAGSIVVEGELRQRLVGEATLGEEGQSIDCRESLQVTGALLVER